MIEKKYLMYPLELNQKVRIICPLDINCTRMYILSGEVIFEYT